jgi:hypothetical protein
VSVVDDGEDRDVAVAPGEGAVTVACPPGMRMCTPRPSIGKRKAKAHEYNCKQQMLASDIKKKQQTALELANAEVVAERSSYLAPLFAAAKLKNVLVQQQFAYQLFMQTPDAVELQPFFAAMRKKYSATKYMVVVVDEDEVEFVESVECDVVDIVDNTSDCDNDDDDEEVIEEQQFEEHFDKIGPWVPGGFSMDTVLEEIAAQCAQPVICIYAVTGSNFSQGTPPPLPSTQYLLAPLQSNDDLQDVEDTQLTTLI